MSSCQAVTSLSVIFFCWWVGSHVPTCCRVTFLLLKKRGNMPASSATVFKLLRCFVNHTALSPAKQWWQCTICTTKNITLLGQSNKKLPERRLVLLVAMAPSRDHLSPNPVRRQTGRVVFDSFCWVLGRVGISILIG